jgi:hypothetical protein
MKWKSLCGFCLLLALAASGGCSIKMDGEFAFMDKWNKHITITKRTETSVPAQPATAEQVDTQEVKVNPK